MKEINDNKISISYKELKKFDRPKRRLYLKTWIIILLTAIILFISILFALRIITFKKIFYKAKPEIITKLINHG